MVEDHHSHHVKPLLLGFHHPLFYAQFGLMHWKRAMTSIQFSQLTRLPTCFVSGL